MRAHFQQTAVMGREQHGGAGGGGGSATLDLVWRVDLAGPLPVSAIRLWDAAAEPPHEGTGVQHREDSGV